jgi:phosphatidylethanolamine-binding protein (PEBP) family uncharacterized protein
MLIPLLNRLLYLYTDSIGSNIRSGEIEMNSLKTIIFIFITLIVSLMIGCTPSSAQLPTNTMSQDSSDNSLLNTPSIISSSTPSTSSTDTGMLNPQANTTNSEFILNSPEVSEGGQLPKDYTCDGNSSTLPLKWTGEPAGTKSFALVMYTIPSPTEIHWYWVLYNIPSSIHELVKNVSGIGMLGNNSVNGKTEYSPPCSKGPGAKQYTYTIYALSDLPQFGVPAGKVNRDILLSAIKDITLASAELNVYYSRQNGRG